MASATAGVSQPRAGLRPQGLFELRLGTFNFGMTQPMIDSQQWGRTHCDKFESTLAALVEGGELDALFGCEVGGHKQGLSQERLARAISAFARGGTESKATQNYIRAWNFGVGGHSGATQPAAARLRLESTTRLTLSNRALDPKLVVDTFLLEHVRGADHLRAYLVVGNLHLRTPQQQVQPFRRNPPSSGQRGFASDREHCERCGLTLRVPGAAGGRQLEGARSGYGSGSVAASMCGCFGLVAVLAGFRIERRLGWSE